MFIGQPHGSVASHSRASGEETLDHTVCGVFAPRGMIDSQMSTWKVSAASASSFLRTKCRLAPPTPSSVQAVWSPRYAQRAPRRTIVLAPRTVPRGSCVRTCFDLWKPLPQPSQTRSSSRPRPRRLCRQMAPAYRAQALLTTRQY